MSQIEKINCLFCNSDKATTVSKRADIVICSSCSITYLRSRPTQDAMYQIYQSYANETSHMCPPDSISAAKHAGLRRTYFIDEILTLNQKANGTWLDVGCGWGALLDEVRDRNFFPMGIEMTRNCLDFASMQLKIPVSNSQLLDSKIEKTSCTVVTMVHVLEHLPYPKEVLMKVYDILEAGGFYCGIVPNINSVCSKYLGDDWVWLDPQHHYVHYSPETLTQVLNDAGFTIVKMYTSTGDYGYQAVIECICNNIPGITTTEMAQDLIPQLEKNGKGEEIRFFALKE